MPVLAQQRLSINSTAQAPIYGLLNELLDEAGRRLELQISFQSLPGERALQLVGLGVDDGECCRVPAAIYAKYPQLLLVDEPLLKVQFAAFTLDPSINIDNWEALRPYQVGYVAGMKLPEHHLNRVQPAGVWAVGDASALFMMLKQGRVDVAVLGRMAGLRASRQQGIDGRVMTNPTPLAQRALYLHLHPRHQELVPLFTAAFKQMRREGVMSELITRRIEGGK